MVGPERGTSARDVVAWKWLAALGGGELILAGVDVDLIVEHVDRARTRSRDGYRPR